MKKIIFIIILITLSSCVSMLHEELAYIKKGMSKDQVFDVITSDEFDDGISIINDDIDSDIYNISVEGASNLEILVTTKYYPDEDALYLFLFENDQLLYWGLPHEFNNSSYELVRNTTVENSKILSKKYIED